MKRFEFGVCEWSVHARGREFCKLAADNGLDCIQLGVGEEIFAQKGLGSLDMVQEYLEAADDYKIKIDSLSPQFVDKYSFTMPRNNQEEELAVRLVEKAIELCSIFRCRYFLLPVLCKNDICNGATFHRAVEYIKRFSVQAGEKGIKTCLELNQSVWQVQNLLEAVDDPRVKIFFDSQNLYALNGTSMADYFLELEDVIEGIHLKDGVGVMLSGSLLGEGTSGFFKTAEAIKKSHYKGSLIIESVYDKGCVCTLGTERELLARDVKTLYRIFGNCEKT